ncbi:MAG: RDD family protein [Acidimicrobiales bacterium]
MSTAGMHATIVTPEGVEISYEPAGLVSRALAILIDMSILFLGLLLLSLVASTVAVATGNPGWFELLVLILIGVGWMLAYPTFMEVHRGGKTIGKSALGIRVISVSGLPLRFRHGFIRATVGLIELYGSLGGIAAIAAVSNAHGQRIGDFAAGTLVVNDRTRAVFSGPMRFTPPERMGSFSSSLDVSSVDGRCHDLLRSFLLRYYGLDEQPRAALADQIYALLNADLRASRPPMMDKAVFLSCVAAQYQATNTVVASAGSQLLAASSTNVHREFDGPADVTALLASLAEDTEDTEDTQSP